MTVPGTPTTPARRWGWVRPRVALPVVAAAVIVVALLTPEETGGRSGDDRLTTRSTGSQGASVLYELAHKLGWQTVQREADSLALGDTAAVHLVLDPAVPLSVAETREVLDQVRRGAGLYYVLGDDGPMADSLGLGERSDSARTLSALGEMLIGSSGRLVASDDDSCPDEDEGVMRAGLPFWPDRQTHLLAIRWKGGPPPGSTPLAMLQFTTATRDTAGTAAIGFPLGRGRVVVAADPDLLRNDVLRVCEWGADVANVRILEYLSAGGPGGGRRERLVFDEYHQGYGEHPGTVKGIVRYLGRTASGHLVLQLAGAGLVLLLAVGPRVLKPRAVERIERRSPLEHVDALARAYRAVGATRTATSRLVHGVRRRVEHALGARSGASSDDAFLSWAEQRAPVRRDDVALVRAALSAPVSRRELEAVGQALQRLELSLTSFPRSS
ncbi:MAG TPA: DUF4350 domain-containing protein [Gemmatimonadaceae bacterium]|nr:DUF4350 domain-containing protein [Gemmatimonadaceae bacterium]